MLEKLISKCDRKEAIVLRSVITGEVRLRLKGETYPMHSGVRLNCTEIATHQEILSEPTIREAVKKMWVTIED